MRNSKMLAGVTLATPVLLAGEANGARASADVATIDEATNERARAQARLTRALLKLDLDAKVQIAGDRLPPLRSAQLCQTPPRSARGTPDTAVCPSVGACAQGQPALRPEAQIITVTCPLGCINRPDGDVINTTLCSDPAAAGAGGGNPQRTAVEACIMEQPPEANTYTTILCPRMPGDEAVIPTAACSEATQPEVQQPPLATGDEAVIYTAACSEAAQPEVQPPPAPTRRARSPRTIPATVGCSPN